MSNTKVEPAIWNITVYQGDDFPFRFRIKRDNVGVDLVEATATVRAQIRASVGSPTVLAEFTIVSLGTDGLVSLLLEPAKTAALPLSGGVWDCEVTLDGVVRTFFKGRVMVSQGVTDSGGA